MLNWHKNTNTKVYVLIVAIALSVTLSAFISLTKSVETQSLLEQKGLTPAFDLLTHEIMKPLFIAETIALASPLKLRMNDDVIDGQKILNKLKQISNDTNTEFFVASEKSRMQYYSNGKTMPLVEGKVEWYFREKDSNEKVVGMLGNRSDVHIYFDVKIHNDEGEFLGFIGASRKLESFINTFENFKKQFGYDFVFVNHHNHVVLSSDVNIIADGNRIVQLHQLPWHQALTSEQKSNNDNKNMLVTVDGEDIIVAEANIESLNWKFFLVNPLKVRQEQAAKQFFLQSFYILCLISLILLSGNIAVHYFQSEFAKKYQKDPLTQLPNRANLTWQFEQMANEVSSISAIMVDVDHFKQVNDSYGHNIGDKALKDVAKILKSQLRNGDIVARWGGEEFVILLPSANLDIAKDVAERARLAISQHDFLAVNKTINVTASFGIGYAVGPLDLASMIEAADRALYTAKEQGRDRVCISQPMKPQVHPKPVSC